MVRLCGQKARADIPGPVPVKAHTGTEVLTLTADRTADLAGRADHTYIRALLHRKGGAVQRWTGSELTFRGNPPNGRTVRTYFCLCGARHGGILLNTTGYGDQEYQHQQYDFHAQDSG
jgi:hypothetical protein